MIRASLLTLACLVCLAVAASTRNEFYTRSTVPEEWYKYYKPSHGSRLFFSPKRPQNKSVQVYICSGYGRTGTTTLTLAFSTQHIFAIHEHSPVTKFPKIAFENKTLAFALQGIQGKHNRYDGTRVALLDNPVGFYAWDLLDGYPNSTVVHSVREPDTWYGSVMRLLKEQSVWPLGEINEIMFSTVFRPPPHKHALRRFFETNNYIISSIPEDRLHVVDVPAGGADVVLGRVLDVPADEIRISHTHNSAKKMGVEVATHDQPRLEDHPPMLSEEANPSGLYLPKYITPVPVDRFPPSSVFYQPDRVTSKHPLVLGVGFEGTGLSALSQAFELLGKDRVQFPAVSMDGKYNSKPVPNSDFLESLYVYGLQGEHSHPSHWADIDLVMGHPLPLFTWDFLEAFPNGKAILTVRDADDWLHAVETLSKTGFEHDGQGTMLLNVWVWGLLHGDHVDSKQRLRKYYEHNSKVIHGVPKHQLLVWDIHANPSWEPLCEFLGVPKPDKPFPKPMPVSW